MKTTVVKVPATKRPQARNVPIGEVYTWGTKQFFYLRVGGGSVLICNRAGPVTSYEFIPDEQGYRSHFDSFVDLVPAELTLEF